MLKTLEKLWPYIAIVFLIIVLVSLFLWPSITQPLVWILIVIITGMAIAFAVRRRIRAYRQNRIDRPTMLRGIGLDIARILITICIAILLAWKAGDYFGRAVGEAVEPIHPGWGSAAGILAGMLTGVVIGLGVAIIVQWIFGFLERLSLGKTAHSMTADNRR
jgi:polyferredoxin